MSNVLQTELAKLPHGKLSEVAKEAKVSQSYLSMLALGQRKNPGLDKAERIAKALGWELTLKRRRRTQRKARLIGGQYWEHWEPF